MACSIWLPVLGPKPGGSASSIYPSRARGRCSSRSSFAGIDAAHGTQPWGPPSRTGQTVSWSSSTKTAQPAADCQLGATEQHQPASNPTVEALLSSPARLQPQQREKPGADHQDGPKRPCLQQPALQPADRKGQGMDSTGPGRLTDHGDPALWASGSLPSRASSSLGAVGDSGQVSRGCLRVPAPKSGSPIGPGQGLFQHLAIPGIRAGLRRPLRGKPVGRRG